MAEDEKKSKKRRKGLKDRRGVSIALTKRGWRAKWIDPDSRKVVMKALWSLGLTTEEAAAAWAQNKSAEVLSRKAELEAGAPRYKSSSLADAVDKFIDGRSELRESTLRYYRLGAAHLTTWAEGAGIRETGDLTGADLARFRAWLTKRSLRLPKRGGGRGARKPTARRISPMTINHRLVIARTLLNELRRLGLTPKLDSDAIKDNLRLVKNEAPVVTFLRGREVEQLLRAALRHDEQTFVLTRAEHDGEGEPGSTQRYAPLAPFSALLVLTGMRLTEARELTWQEVDLEHREIVLGTRTKTKTGRRIPLDVCPRLHDLLGRLKLRSSGGAYVFGGKEAYTEAMLKRGLYRLKQYGAPAFSWQDLRRTCGTYLTCAPAIYGAASAFLSAKRLGHSVLVAEKHYAGAVTDIPPTAKTLEAALGIEDAMARILCAAGGPVPVRAAAEEA